VVTGDHDAPMVKLDASGGGLDPERVLGARGPQQDALVDVGRQLVGYLEGRNLRCGSGSV
jgi:hypothetical protein